VHKGGVVYASRDFICCKFYRISYSWYSCELYFRQTE